MKNTSHISKIFFRFMLMTILSTGCTVIKKPYFTQGYYRNTADYLAEHSTINENTTDSLFSGFSRVSITPDTRPHGDFGKRGVPIAGFGQLKTKYATGVHDSIFVRAVAMQAGQNTVYMISSDLLIISPDITELLMKKLEPEGIRREQIFLSASHSHSSLGGWGYGFLAKVIAGKQNQQIKEWITDDMVAAVKSARADLRPASIGSGSFSAPLYTRNRLTGDDEKLNTDFDFLLIRQENGRKCIIGSYSAHATTSGGKNTLISADYPGFWAGRLEGHAADVAMFCGGSMGSQSPVGEGDGLERGEYIGERLADSTLNHLQQTPLSKIVNLNYLSVPVGLPRYHIRLTKNLNFPTFMSRWLMAKPEDVYLQSLRLNDLVWFTTPGDFSGESAMMIKNVLALKGTKAVVSGYNGAYVGYIIPSKYYYYKHYEPRSMGWFGPYMGDYIPDIMLRMAKVVMAK